MPDFARLRRDPGANAGELVLFGTRFDDVTRRAFVGVRPEQHLCGLLRLYAEGISSPTVNLYSTLQHNARLQLESPLPGGELFHAAELGSFGTDAQRWGHLILSAVNSTGDARLIASIGPDHDHQRGVLRLTDAEEGLGAGHVELGVDSAGPYLFMSDGDLHSVMITPTGMYHFPAKIGEWNFVANDPTCPERQIHYNVLEGPEVGVYVRGTASLVRGRARVPLPDHLALVASEKGLTVQLTARSADSEGVAAVRVTLQELELCELRNGTGSYDVDYLVHAVRTGHQEFQVFRPRRPGMFPGAPSRRTATAQRCEGREGVEE